MYFRCFLTDSFTAHCITPRTLWANTITATPGIRAPKPNPGRSMVPLGEPTVTSIPTVFFSRCIMLLIIMDSESWQLICLKRSDNHVGGVGNVPWGVKAFALEERWSCIKHQYRTQYSILNFEFVGGFRGRIKNKMYRWISDFSNRNGIYFYKFQEIYFN